MSSTEELVNKPVKEIVDLMWTKERNHPRSGMYYTQVECNECKGPNSCFCDCARKKFFRTVPLAEIQKFVDKFSRRLDRKERHKEEKSKEESHREEKRREESHRGERHREESYRVDRRKVLMDEQRMEEERRREKERRKEKKRREKEQSSSSHSASRVQYQGPREVSSSVIACYPYNPYPQQTE